MVQRDIQGGFADALDLLQDVVALTVCERTEANSSSVSLAGLLRMSSGTAILPTSCNSPAMPACLICSCVMPSWLASEIIMAHTATECM
jgi:hypothetical protein